MLPNQFTIRSVLVVVVLVSTVIGVAAEYGKTHARFQILEAEMRQLGGGLSSGTLMWTHEFEEEVAEEEVNSRRETLLIVDSAKCDRLCAIAAGDEFTIRFRSHENLLFAKQNPFVMFLTRKLQIRKQDIVGFVELDGQSQVIVRGKAE